MQNNLSRIIIAGLSGDSGKTLLSLGLISCWRKKGLDTIGFKKGPDYIDASWLAKASGKPGRNLDTFIMDKDEVYNSFTRNSQGSDISLIEGNRGIFDGMDSEGLHSTAELAKLLKAPVILIIDVTKMTRTASALILGCKELDPELNIAGVIINKVAGSRHQRVVSEAIENYTGIPVLGSIPKLKKTKLIPGRHLGLVTPHEHPRISMAIDTAADIISEYVDIEKVEEIAENAQPLDEMNSSINAPAIEGRRLRICYFCDSAFTFYYPENLEILRSAGVELVPVSSLDDKSLPDIDALYIGGGFPETHLAQLAQNRSLMKSVKSAAENELPIYAECGGLIYLSEALIAKGDEIPMAGVLPVKIELMDKPQGHGYTEVIVDSPNAFYGNETQLRGHEFHYTKVIKSSCGCSTVFKVVRGTGCFDERDGLVYKNVLACYTHLHSLGTPEWAKGFLKAASEYQLKKNEPVLVGYEIVDRGICKSV